MKKILLFGAGSQAAIVNELIAKSNTGKVTLLYDPTISSPNFSTKIKFTNDFDQLMKSIGKRDFDFFHVCIGNHFGYSRVKISMFLENCGLNPISVISSKSIIDRTATIKQGALIMPGAVLQCHSFIDRFAVINTGAIIEHEAIICEGSHIMSGAVVLGRATVNKYSSIGANSIIFPDVSIGESVIIGAGSLVNKNVQNGLVMLGSPARLHKSTPLQHPVILI